MLFVEVTVMNNGLVFHKNEFEDQIHRSNQQSLIRKFKDHFDRDRPS